MEKIAKNHKAFFHEILRMKQKLISFAISAVIIMVLLPDTFAFSESGVTAGHLCLFGKH